MIVIEKWIALVTNNMQQLLCCPFCLTFFHLIPLGKGDVISFQWKTETGKLSSNSAVTILALLKVYAIKCKKGKLSSDSKHQKFSNKTACECGAVENP